MRAVARMVQAGRYRMEEAVAVTGYLTAVQNHTQVYMHTRKTERVYDLGDVQHL